VFETIQYPLVYSSTIECSIEGFAGDQFVLEFGADGAAEKDAVYCALEFATADACRATVQFCFFREHKFLESPWNNEYVVSCSFVHLGDADDTYILESTRV
jgi:hypothetical protein